MKNSTAHRKAQHRVIAIQEELKNYNPRDFIQSKRINDLKEDLYQFVTRNKLDPSDYLWSFTAEQKARARVKHEPHAVEVVQLEIPTTERLTAEEYLVRDIKRNGTLDNPARVIRLMEEYARL